MKTFLTVTLSLLAMLQPCPAPFLLVPEIAPLGDGTATAGAAVALVKARHDAGSSVADLPMQQCLFEMHSSDTKHQVTGPAIDGYNARPDLATLNQTYGSATLGSENSTVNAD